MKILENKLINKAELARLVWPNQKEPRNYLAQRISHIRGRKLSEKDIKTIKTELKEFAENLLNQLENEDIIYNDSKLKIILVHGVNCHYI